ncbi:MAG: ABC transporter substrate-binding protein [Candidatus Methanofastidiosia archaeon]|jgi:ABC-type transport system substrate-binding protein
MKKIALFLGLVVVLSTLPVTADRELFELTLICPDNYAFRMDYTMMIKDEFENVGIHTDVYFMSLDEMMKRCTQSGGSLYKDGGFDIAVFNWYITGEIGYWYLYEQFHSDNSVTQNFEGENIMSWENAYNDELINKMETATDEEFTEYLRQWQELFYEEQPLIPLYQFSRMEDNQEYWEYSHLSLNLNHADLKKKRVRQALSHLIPRQKICDLHNEDTENQWPGTFTKAEPLAVPYYPDLYQPHTYDLEHAKELLSEAGYKTGGFCLGTGLIVVVMVCLFIVGKKRI